MQVEHLNYCRQLVKQLTGFLEIPSLDQVKRAGCRHALDLVLASQKFMLPTGGRLLDDNELRALDGDELLHLPHRFVALEYRPLGAMTETLCVPCSRRVLFARQHDDHIALDMALWLDSQGVWAFVEGATIPRTGYIDRSQTVRGSAFMKFSWPRGQALEDWADEVGTLLSFLNALACSNVHVERSEARKPGKKVKAALPFDAYHVLTIDVGHLDGTGDSAGSIGHRSPREHLRRGHIVRPEGRRPYWRNATVVNAGRGFGKVDKDYRLRNRTTANSNHVPPTPGAPPCP